MSVDAALAEYRAARQQLFDASRERERLATQRNRVASAIDAQNVTIAQARARVTAARTALQSALRDEPQEP